MNIERKDNTEILSDLRRDGKVPVSAVSLKALVLLLITTAILIFGSDYTAMVTKSFEQSTLNDLLGILPSGISLMFAATALLVIVFSLGFFQSNLFFSFDKVTPHIPQLGAGFDGIVGRIAFLTLTLLVAILLVCTALYYVAPFFLSSINLPFDQSLSTLTKLLHRILLSFCLLGAAAILIAAISNKIIFIFINRKD